jgi:alpha-tubulin suppressor-like RCC1 family protein
LLDNGVLYSWGGNKEGILGIGNKQDQYMPVEVLIDNQYDI